MRKYLSLALFAVVTALPGIASAGLLQDVIIEDYTDDDGNFLGDLRLGTLSFPSQRQMPTIFGRPDPTCVFGAPTTLPTCSTGEFLPDFASFPGLDDIGGTGVSLPASLPFFGAWEINADTGAVDFIFAWTRLNLGPGNGINTLVFGSLGTFCGMITDGFVSPGQCFGMEDVALLDYRLESASVVPEPGTMGLIGLGLLTLLGVRRKIG